MMQFMFVIILIKCILSKYNDFLLELLNTGSFQVQNKYFGKLLSGILKAIMSAHSVGNVRSATKELQRQRASG